MSYPLQVKIEHLSDGVPTELHGRLGDLYVYARSRGEVRKLFVGKRNSDSFAEPTRDIVGVPDDVETYRGQTRGFDDVFVAEAHYESRSSRAELLGWIDETLKVWQQGVKL